METSGAITPIVMEPYELAFNLTLYFPLILLIVYYLIRTITNALATSQRELTERLRIESEREKLIVQLSEEVAERKRAQDELQQLAMTDPLTGMFNRRHFFEMAEVEFAKTTRYARPLSIVIFDIDLFKGINDTYGHPAGDQVLIQISDVLRTKVRRTDFSGRYGGEEFIVLLTETGISGAQSFAEHLRRLVEEMPVQYGGNSISVTASFGVASREQLEPNQTLDHLIFLADQALYEAKKTGRNRVVCHHTEG